MATDITQEYLKECFEYNEVSGDLIWKHRPKNHFKKSCAHGMFESNCAGNKVGSIFLFKGRKYLRTKLKGKYYFAHRLIWILVYGCEPIEIDHIDGNGLNNKISNLRNVDRKENGKNLRLYNNNKSGVSGVSFKNWHKKWYAGIKVNGLQIGLGVHADKFEAICARKSAENKYSFHVNHGNPK